MLALDFVQHCPQSSVEGRQGFYHRISSKVLKWRGLVLNIKTQYLTDGLHYFGKNNSDLALLILKLMREEKNSNRFPKEGQILGRALTAMRMSSAKIK